MFYKGKKREGRISKDHSDFHAEGSEIRKEIIRRIEIPKGSGEIRVLDVGTGFGTTVSLLAKKFPKKRTKIWTIDPSRQVLNSVRKDLREKELDSNVNFVLASAEKLDKFQDDYFDLVISVMVLHHLVAIKPVLKEMTRVVRKSGKILLLDWKPEAHELPFQSGHMEKDFFKTSDIEELANKLGLDVKVDDHKFWYLVELCKS
ncbi:MAG: class I SAM-dependent methyltransferase [Nitrososphaerales archaeon]